MTDPSAQARSVGQVDSAEFDDEHDDTAPLATLGESAEIVAEAANYIAETISDSTTEKLDRLIELAESMNAHLERIAREVGQPRPRFWQRTMKGESESE